jgi:hypothetical protein
MSKDETKKVDLFNKSDRTIQTKEGNLGPKSSEFFSSGLAARLLKLYPDELESKSGPVNVEDDAVLTDDDLEKEVNKLKVPELKAELDEADPVIEYDDNALKADLVALVVKKRKAESEAA